MPLTTLRTILIAYTATFLLIGAAAAPCRAADNALTSTNPAPTVKTLQPLAGEWEGSYETRSDFQSQPHRQIVTLIVRSLNQGRACEIDLRGSDGDAQGVFRFQHALNTNGTRIQTTDDPALGGTVLDGLVTESAHDVTTGDWRVGFRANRRGNTNFTECLWIRQGDNLTIKREDVNHGLDGPVRLVSEMKLRPRGSKSRSAFNALPRGTPTFDGVMFTVQKPINIIGARAANVGGRAFARVTDDTIKGRGQHIHVLHTGDHGSSETGDYIWRLVLHYADGKSERFDFAYDIHIRNFWRRADDGPRTPSDPDSSLAWVGTSLESDPKGADLVVSRTTLANPHPNIQVTGAEFVTLLGPSSSYVLGVTINDEGPKPTGRFRTSATNTVPLTLRFEDMSQQPHADRTVDCEFECDGYTVRGVSHRTNAKGQITLDIPLHAVRTVRYQTQSSSGRTKKGEVEVSADKKELVPALVRLSD
jgi:hypothetical protein